MALNSSEKAMNPRFRLAIIGGFATALSWTAAAQAAVAITTCGYTISTPGNYTLTADLSQCTVSGVIITVSNVNLKLDGHVISGGGGSGDNYSGILIQGAGRIKNIQIQGRALIEQFRQGIMLTNVDNSQIQGVVSAFNIRGIVTKGCTNLQINVNTFSANYFSGIDLEGDSSDEIQQNEVTGNDTSGENYPGIAIWNGSSGNRVHDNNAGGNYSGISIAGSSNNNMVYSNTVFVNTGPGILVSDGGDNNIHDNTAEGNGHSEAEYFDLFDSNSNCGANRWHNNTFFTANQPCVD